MTLEKIIETGLVKDSTILTIRKYGEYGMIVAAIGNWFQDNVLDYLNNEIESFTWQDDDYFYIDLKEVEQ